MLYNAYPNWLVALIILFIVFLTAGLIYMFYKHIKLSKPSKQIDLNKRAVVASFPEWYSYNADDIFKIRWTWKYNDKYSYRDVYDMYPTCLKCKGDIELREGYDSLKVLCPSCNTVVLACEGTAYKFKEIVKAEIRKNIRVKFNVD